MSFLSKLWPSSTPAELVKERDAGLADNTSKIEDIAALKERLRVCFEAVKAANPTLFATLNAPNHVLNEKEMAEQIKILTLATMTDLQSLSQDLDEVRKKREQLMQLLQIWEKIEAHFDAALASGTKVAELDQKNIENLTEAQAMVRQLGVQPTCRGISP